MKPHLRRPVWTKMFCPLRSYVGLNMHTVSCHSPFVVMDTDKGWVGVGAGGLGLKKGKENIICVHSNWVKFSAAKNGLDKSLFRDLRCVCAAGRGRRQPNRSYTTDTRLWQDLPLMKKKKRYTTQNTLQNASTVGYSHQPFAQYGGEDSQLQFPVSGVWEKIGLPPLKTEQGFLGKPLIPFRNLSQLL